MQELKKYYQFTFRRLDFKDHEVVIAGAPGLENMSDYSMAKKAGFRVEFGKDKGNSRKS